MLESSSGAAQPPLRRWLDRRSPLTRQFLLVVVLSLVAAATKYGCDRVLKSPLGERCKTATDCQSGLCSVDARCTKLCTSDSDCPDGDRCVDTTFTLSAIELDNARSGAAIGGSRHGKTCQRR